MVNFCFCKKRQMLLIDSLIPVSFSKDSCNSLRVASFFSDTNFSTTSVWFVNLAGKPLPLCDGAIFPDSRVLL